MLGDISSTHEAFHTHSPGTRHSRDSGVRAGVLEGHSRGTFGVLGRSMTGCVGEMRWCVCRSCADTRAEQFHALADQHVEQPDALADPHADVLADPCAELHVNASAPADCCSRSVHSSSHHRRDTRTHTNSTSLTNKHTMHAHTHTVMRTVTHTHTRTRTHARAHTHSHAPTKTYTHKIQTHPNHRHRHTQTHSYTHACTHTHAHPQANTHVHNRTHPSHPPHTTPYSGEMRLAWAVRGIVQRRRRSRWPRRARSPPSTPAARTPRARRTDVATAGRNAFALIECSKSESNAVRRHTRRCPCRCRCRCRRRCPVGPAARLPAGAMHSSHRRAREYSLGAPEWPGWQLAAHG
jgi:hypothetical protein